MFISWGSSKYCFQLAWHRLTTWLLCWLCQSLLWSFHKDKDQGEWIVKEIIYNLTGFLFKRRPSRARRCWGIEAGVQKRQLPCFTIFTFLSWCLVHLKGQHVAEISVFKMVHYFHCQYDVVLLTDPWQPILKLHSRNAPSHRGVHVAAAALVPVAFALEIWNVYSRLFC